MILIGSAREADEFFYEQAISFVRSHGGVSSKG